MSNLTPEEYQCWLDQLSGPNPVTQKMIEGTLFDYTPKKNTNTDPDRYYGYDDPLGSSGQGSNTSSFGSGGGW